MKLPNACPKPRVVKKARQPLRAKKRMRGRSKRSAKSQGHLFPKNVLPEFRDFVRGLPCVIRDRWYYVGRFDDNRAIIQHVCGRDTICAHVKSRGAGGDDRANVVPMCAGAHDEQHRIGIRSFEKRWGVDLRAEAARVWAAYLKETE